MSNSKKQKYDYHLPECVIGRPRTRIVCTLGPATDQVEIMCDLIRAGMSVARLNLSHGDSESHRNYVKDVRAAAEITGAPIGILADLPGPKYRSGDVDEGTIQLERGARLTLTASTVKTTADRTTVWPPGIHHDVSVDSRILIDEGAIELVVERVDGVDVHCRVTSPGALGSRKAVTTPGITSTLDYLTNETRSALEFVKENDVEFVGLSYVRNSIDLEQVKGCLKDSTYPHQLIAKIEVAEGVNNLKSILDQVDGLMVARGDLGVELPIEDVPGIQRRMIREANDAGKVVITATQMLESMIESSQPTRAEASDVHNAVRDGSDAIMLSGETSIGKYPVRTVEYMAQIARRAEEELDYSGLLERRREAREASGQSLDEAIAYGAVRTARAVGASVILAFTESGSTAARVASYRPSTPLVAMLRDETAGSRLTLRWGLITLYAPEFSLLQQMFPEGSRAAKETGFASDGDLAVAVAGIPIGVPGNTNLLRVIRIPEPVTPLSPGV